MDKKNRNIDHSRLSGMRLLLPAVFALLCGNAAFAAVTAEVQKPQSTYRIHYYINKFNMAQGPGKNAAELTRLDKFIGELTGDTNIIVKSATLTGTCSIEGSLAGNTVLGRKRAEGVLDYLNTKYDFSNRYNVTVRSIPEDWETLRSQVDTSKMAARDRILTIIDSAVSPDTKEYRIKALDGGAPYNYIFRRFLPASRHVDLQIDFQMREYAAPKQEVAPVPAEEAAPLPAAPVVTTVPEPAPAPAPAVAATPAKECGCADRLPVFAIKTNLLQWGGLVSLSPTVERPYLPNAAIEYYFAQRWSVHAEGAYCFYSYDGDDKRQGIASYGGELRWWLKPDSRFRWFYAGVYGQGGDYDYQQGRDPDVTTYTNYTGKHWSAGLSLGVMVPIWCGLAAEATLHGGFRHYYTNVYDRELPDNFYNYTTYTDKWGITGAYVNLVYRFGRKAK